MQFPRFRLLVLVAVAAWLQGCNDLPRDPEGTSTRVAGARLRVGLIEQHPWVVRTSGEPSGVEVALVRELARELHAQPEWHWGGEELHMHALEKFELDLVVGGLTSRTPWKKHVGVTRPYFEDERAVGGKVLVQKHVMAVPPGENAWLKRVQEFLYRNRTEAARLAQSEAR